MKKLDFSEMTEVLREWLDNNGFEEVFVQPSLEFEYLYYDKAIGYSILSLPRADELFMNFAFDNDLEQDCSCFILSFFHELGHYITLDKIDDDVYNSDRKIKQSLSDSDEDMNIYFNLETEKTATLWAIQYINKHYDDIMLLEDEFFMALRNFVDKYEEIEVR